MGRPRKPLRLLKLSGSFRADRHGGRTEAAPPPALPPMPEIIKADLVGSKEWRRVARELHGAGLLCKLDMATLAAYALAFSKWTRAENELKALGLVIKSQSGAAVENPWAGIARRASKEMRECCGALGLNALARTKIDPAPVEEEPTEFDKYLAESDAQ